MRGILDVITQNILPIFLVAGLGFVLRRWGGIDKRMLSRVTFYGFSPCLVFSSLVQAQIPLTELTQLAGFIIVTILSMGVVGWLSGRLLRLSRVNTAALVLTLMFVNGGNFGMTLNEIRYGEEGLARAAIYFITSTVLLYTIGIFIASAGQQSWRAAALELLRVPAFYAVILAILVYGFQIQLPAPFLRSVEIAGAGAIPVMIVVLGMQMADLQQFEGVKLALTASGLRLIFGAAVGILWAYLFRLEGLNRSVMIIEASMPTAVALTIVATEFDLRPRLVTTIVVFSTLISPLTLAVVINLLGL